MLSAEESFSLEVIDAATYQESEIAMEHDDLPVGRILGRREILAIFGFSTIAVMAGCVPVRQLPSPRGGGEPGNMGGASDTTSTTSMCIVSPEQAQGPYFSDVQLNRADIRTDPADGTVSEGALLQLTLNINQVTEERCEPLPNAIVDIWHCDAHGVYSDFAGESSAGQKFLRGYQVSNDAGVVQFTTIYPGWYRGRTAHIHLKVRTEDESGQAYDFTSQCYFDDEVTDQIYSQAPYTSRPNRSTRNSNDGIYNSGGERMVVGITPTDEGYAGTLDIGIYMAVKS